MQHIEQQQPSSVVPFVLGLALASAVAFILQTPPALGNGTQECLSAKQINADGILANNGKSRPAIDKVALLSPDIAGHDKLRRSGETVVASSVSYIRCLRKVT